MSNIFKVFTLFDVKGNDHGVPFFSLSDGVAQRSFGDILSDPSCLCSRHPEDYHLYCVGTFDSGNGMLTPASPRFICSGSDLCHAARPGRISGGSVRGAGESSPCPCATDEAESSESDPAEI